MKKWNITESYLCIDYYNDIEAETKDEVNGLGVRWTRIKEGKEMNKINPNEKIFIPTCFGVSRFRTYKYLSKKLKKLVNPKTLTMDWEKPKKGK